MAAEHWQHIIRSVASQTQTSASTTYESFSDIQHADLTSARPYVQETS